MYSTILSGALSGVSAALVHVEADISQGLPAFLMVGSLSAEVRESRERVLVALKNMDIAIPPCKITINLSPADQRKEGTAYDLPIAVGILASLGLFEASLAEDTLFLGELGLNGEVRGVLGVLPIVKEAAKRGVKECIVPKVNATEGAVIPGITVRGVETLGDLLCFLQSQKQAKSLAPKESLDVEALFAGASAKNDLDFAQVNGQEAAKRAAVIAAAGFHNLLMVGPPGAGKSMIAKRIPGIMPPLSLEESLEVTAIYSVAGRLAKEEALMLQRPFQSPHHTISMAALNGGSGHPKPGIISLAHRGVLFLDELPQFGRSLLDSLRQPLEERRVQIDRVGGNVSYPADFMLVCAMNPCPCGYYPNPNRCHCAQPKVHAYMSRVSGPILDRIDLCVELSPVDVTSLQPQRKVQTTEEIRACVAYARAMQKKRYAGSAYRFNADVDSARLETFCPLSQEAREQLESLYHTLDLSARAYHRIWKVARTIADLEGSSEILAHHILEAACYRPSLEYWI